MGGGPETYLPIGMKLPITLFSNTQKSSLLCLNYAYLCPIISPRKYNFTCSIRESNALVKFLSKYSKFNDCSFTTLTFTRSCKYSYYTISLRTMQNMCFSFSNNQCTKVVPIMLDYSITVLGNLMRQFYCKALY